MCSKIHGNHHSLSLDKRTANTIQWLAPYVFCSNAQQEQKQRFEARMPMRPPSQTVIFVIYIQRNLYSDTQNAHATNLLLTHMQPDNDKHASMPRVELGILTAEWAQHSNLASLNVWRTPSYSYLVPILSKCNWNITAYGWWSDGKSRHQRCRREASMPKTGCLHKHTAHVDIAIMMMMMICNRLKLWIM